MDRDGPRCVAFVDQGKNLPCKRSLSDVDIDGTGRLYIDGCDGFVPNPLSRERLIRYAKRKTKA